MKVEKVYHTHTDLYKTYGLLKTFNICPHKNATTGQSLIVFKTDKWTGVSPRKYKGICVKCLKEFELTQEQYERYQETGEMPQ